MILPGLITYPQIDPVMVQIGPLKIRWYGMAYLTAFVLAYFVLGRLVKKGTSADFAKRRCPTWSAGWRWAWWRGDASGGGFSIIARSHPTAGAVVGADRHLARRDVVSWRADRAYCWSFGFGADHVELPFLNVADCLALVTPIGLFLGRIANFINGGTCGAGDRMCLGR